jgi:predicted alternative tryptophan synthase beta-subunit
LLKVTSRRSNSLTARDQSFDVGLGCNVRGGSNFGGTAFPFLADKAAGKLIRLVALVPSAISSSRILSSRLRPSIWPCF